MKEWDNCLIDDLGTIVGGSTPRTSISEYWDGSIPWITPRDMSQQTGEKYISNGERFITEKGLENSSAKLLPKGTVLFTSRAPIGYIGIASQELVTNQGFKSIIVNEKNDNEFVYYLLKFSLNKIIGMAGGSTFKEINSSSFKKIEIKVPPLSTQHRIAAILSALDDKIENNRRICETLEQLAQAVFKRWFVDFDFPDAQGRPYKSSGGRMVESELGLIPEGWEVGVLNDLVTNINESCKTNNKKLPYLPIDVIPKSKLGIENYDSWENAKSSLIKFKEDDIIIGAMRIYFHRVVLSPFSGITRTTCIILRPKSKSDRLFSLFHVNQDNFIEWASNNSKGSTMPYAFWNNGIENHKIVIPPVCYREEFEKIISPLVQIIKTDYKNSISLQQTRDTLLPKLMSGEVEV